MKNMRVILLALTCLMLTACAQHSGTAAEMSEPDISVETTAVKQQIPCPVTKQESVVAPIPVPTENIEQKKPDAALPTKAEKKQEHAQIENIVTTPAPAQETPKKQAAAEPTVKSEPIAVAQAPKQTETAKTVIDSAKTGGSEIAIDSAKTGGTEIIIDSAKTDPEADTPVVTPQTSTPQEHADIQSAMAVANAYAQETYGVILDASLGFDNSGYRFPGSTLATASQADVENKAKGIVDYTFNQLMAVNHKTIEDVRSAEFQCSVYIYEDGGTIYCYCFYA